ncbi:Glucooligosaccharide oxidase [Xylariomycetidae sp. FL0641]|nr:Glucooligosaccharide oxidase [Xylariomycetidae sp. FL0641]
MGQNSSTPFSDCLDAVCNGRDDCVAYTGSPLYQLSWVHPYNLAIDVDPIAVTRPETAEDVSNFVKCAVANNVKVQPKSGGHSYANFGLGDEQLVVDLQKMTDFSMDTDTWLASIGGGTKLSEVDDHLDSNGKRAMPHGTCPGVGIGGHATIGGLGPSSRMWGACLDQIVEVEAVLANGTIVRANDDQNSDLFFALKGAGAGFGIITEFVMKTYPSPGHVVQYSFSLSFGKHEDMVDVVQQWQDLIADPDLDRRFGSEFVIHALGVAITGTFYGTEEEWEASGIPDKVPKGGNVSVVIDDWLGLIAQQAEEAALWLSDTQTEFIARSLAFRADELPSTDTLTKLMTFIDDNDDDQLTWFLILDASGGAVSDVATNATAYAHRDKVMFAQAYGIGIPTLTNDTESFIQGMTDIIQDNTPETLMVYPGYVDVSLVNAQELYWGSNLPALGEIKAKYDPNDTFHNPQSVRPGEEQTSSASPRRMFF